MQRSWRRSRGPPTQSCAAGAARLGFQRAGALLAMTLSDGQTARGEMLTKLQIWLSDYRYVALLAGRTASLHEAVCAPGAGCEQSESRSGARTQVIKHCGAYKTSMKPQES